MALSEAAITAIIGAAGAAAGAIGSASAPALSNRRAYKNWLKQHDIQLQDWERQNSYNLPVNQVQRYIDAGINPNLVAGGDNTASSISSPGQIPQFPENFSGVGDIATSAINNYIKGVEVERTNRLVQQQINESAARENYYSGLTDLNSAKSAFEYLKYYAYRDNDMFGLQADQMRKNIALLIGKNASVELYNQFLDNTMDARIKFEALKNGLTLSKTAKNYSDISLNNSRINLNKSIEDLNTQSWRWNFSTIGERWNQLLDYGEFLRERASNVRANTGYYRSRSRYTDWKTNAIIPQLFFDGVRSFGSFH